MKNKITTLLLLFALISYAPFSYAKDLGKMYDDALIKADEKTDPWNPNYVFPKAPGTEASNAVAEAADKVIKSPVENTISQIKKVEAAQAKKAATFTGMLIGRFVAATPASKIVAKATGNRLASLDGIWILKKRVIRRIPAATIIPVYNKSCNARFPYEKNTFTKKVLISREDGTYVFRQLYGVSHHKFKDKTGGLGNTQINYGLMGALDLENLTYAYTLKNQDFMKQPTRARQTVHNGKIFYEEISPIKIAGTGYEIVHTPECMGFMRDEIEFVLVRSEGDGTGGDGASALKQSDDDGLSDKGDFRPVNPDDPGIPDGAIPTRAIPKDSAVAKRPFNPGPGLYRDEDAVGSLVPGMW